MISYIWRNLGYDVVLWMAGLSAIPALYEAAKVDGAGEWKCFTKITRICSVLLRSWYFLYSMHLRFSVRHIWWPVIIRRKMYLLQHLFNNWYRDLSLDKMSASSGDRTGDFLLILGLWKAWGKGGAE